MSPLTPGAFRARFPLLDRRVYVNSCSQGALSTDVEAALACFTRSWHDEGSPWERWVGEVERLRSAVAALVGADPDEIAIMPSASAAIAAVATSLRFDAGRPQVVLGQFEFPTMAHGWLAQQPRGASIEWVRSTNGELTVSAYTKAVDDHTLIVPVTHVCFRNGYRLDVPGLPVIEQQIAKLVERFAEGARRLGLDVMTPQDPARRGPLVVIRVPDAPEIVRRLAVAGIIASARGDGLRVSFHAYNNDEDVDAVLGALS